MAPPLPSSWRLSLSLLLSASTALAQITSGPQPASGPAFARTSTRLYIQGGSYPSGNFDQFFSLDLAVPWNTSTPVWTQLQNGPQQSVYPAVFSSDQKTMITFHSGTPFAMRYNVASKQWSPSNIVPTHDWQGTSAVTDPNTGVVYIAGGYAGENRSSMDIYNFDTDTLVAGSQMTEQAMASFPNRAYYANVWSQSRKSILYFGGYNSTLKQIPDQNTVTEFVPASGSYSILPTFGTIPPMRADHCMTSNDDGTLVVVYGGRLTNDPNFNGDLYILDLTTQTWRKGTAGPPRVYAACTVAGDQFLMWGGKASDNSYAPAQVMIYSLTNNNWVSRYAPPQSYVDLRASEEPQTSSPGTSTGSKDSGPNPGAIAGGVVGGVAIICIAVLFFIFRRRQHRQHRPIPLKTTDNQDDTPTLKPSPPPLSNQDDELERMRIQIQNQQEQLELQRRLMQLQQQNLQMAPQPMPTYQYQEPTYSYQPPIVYSGGSPSNPASSTVHSDPSGFRSSPDTVNSVTGLNHHGFAVTSTPTGYADGNSQYVEAHAMTPLAYAPPPTAAVLAPKTVKNGNYWGEERPLGNPHAVIET